VLPAQLDIEELADFTWTITAFIVQGSDDMLQLLFPHCGLTGR
jgi:hypothetical protein